MGAHQQQVFRGARQLAAWLTFETLAVDQVELLNLHPGEHRDITYSEPRGTGSHGLENGGKR